MNFRDVLTVLQMYPGDAAAARRRSAPGWSSKSVVLSTAFRPGDRVFGFAPASLGTEAIVPAAFLAADPRRMRGRRRRRHRCRFLDGVYGLHRLAGLRAGERVLIHAAAGGVGLAAVQLAQRCGAEVFATAGSPAKRDMLRDLASREVMDSRSVAFADEVIAATGGAGVDVVLNSLAGEFIPAGIRVLAPGGCFLELGKRGIWTERSRSRPVRPDVRYHVYDLGARGASGSQDCCGRYSTRS